MNIVALSLKLPPEEIVKVSDLITEICFSYYCYKHGLTDKHYKSVIATKLVAAKYGSTQYLILLSIYAAPEALTKMAATMTEHIDTLINEEVEEANQFPIPVTYKMLEMHRKIRSGYFTSGVSGVAAIKATDEYKQIKDDYLAAKKAYPDMFQKMSIYSNAGITTETTLVVQDQDTED